MVSEYERYWRETLVHGLTRILAETTNLKFAAGKILENQTYMDFKVFLDLVEAAARDWKDRLKVRYTVPEAGV